MGQIIQDLLGFVNIILRSDNNMTGKGTGSGVCLRTSYGRRIRWIVCKRQVRFCRDGRRWWVKGLTKEVGRMRS